jgi:hypothetical protein
MGELDLDNIERLLLPEWQERHDCENDRGKKAQEDNQFRCIVCGQPLRLARMVNGNPYCRVHAGALSGKSKSHERPLNLFSRLF